MQHHTAFLFHHNKCNLKLDSLPCIILPFLNLFIHIQCLNPPPPQSIFILFPFLFPVSLYNVLTYSLNLSFPSILPLFYSVPFYKGLPLLSPVCFTLSSSQSLALSFPFFTTSYLLVLQFLR